MYKSKEFDYDLWTTTENGTKHYWARVKATGEVTEVSHEVMKFLRAEEKRVYREIEASQNRGSTLSLDAPHDEEKESWFEDYGSGVSEMETELNKEDFRKLLTGRQREIFDYCLIGGNSVRKFAREKGLDHTTVMEAVEVIREKAKKFFNYTPPKA